MSRLKNAEQPASQSAATNPDLLGELVDTEAVTPDLEDLFQPPTPKRKRRTAPPATILEALTSSDPETRAVGQEIVRIYHADRYNITSLVKEKRDLTKESVICLLTLIPIFILTWTRPDNEILQVANFLFILIWILNMMLAVKNGVSSYLYRDQERNLLHDLTEHAQAINLRTPLRGSHGLAKQLNELDKYEIRQDALAQMKKDETR